ncbi:hypothetical protein [Collimonas antrihumi]|uniref:hypothetical protein n=1 Tax=Collimonas antrihumi TaxID=1940615 RepID=UPI001B8C10E2|nr:hypothetical protein [Collimonas antrihumi]
MRDALFTTWLGFRNLITFFAVTWCLFTPVSIIFLVTGWESNDDFHRIIFTVLTLLGFIGLCYLIGSFFCVDNSDVGGVRKQPWEV